MVWNGLRPGHFSRRQQSVGSLVQCGLLKDVILLLQLNERAFRPTCRAIGFTLVVIDAKTAVVEIRRKELPQPLFLVAVCAKLKGRRLFLNFSLSFLFLHAKPT